MMGVRTIISRRWRYRCRAIPLLIVFTAALAFSACSDNGNEGRDSHVEAGESGERGEHGVDGEQSEHGERGVDGEHGERGEGGGEDSGEGEESGDLLALDETYDTVRKGARLILRYDAESNSFVGTVQNTTDEVLYRVRVEVHLSNGTELGPTTPVDLEPGVVANVAVPATEEPFTGWTPHAEVGKGEHGEGSGGEHGEGGEGTEGGEGGSEHGTGGEGDGGGGEHGEDGEDGEGGAER